MIKNERENAGGARVVDIPNKSGVKLLNTHQLQKSKDILPLRSRIHGKVSMVCSVVRRSLIIGMLIPSICWQGYFWQFG